MAKHYGDKLRIVVKFAPYPDRENARFAARAALAAGAQGKYWPMHHKMLEHYYELNPKNLIKFAGELGMDTAKFENDMNAAWTDKKVADDLKLTRGLDIWQTPTYLINGRKMVGERPVEHFYRIIDEELERAKK